jgi:hypothetical protein
MKSLLLMALAPAFAQQFEPFPVTVRQMSARSAQLMQLPGYREKAGGAYLVGRCHLQDQAATVASQLAGLRGLAAYPLRSDTPASSVIQATLDALIQLGYPVPGADLLPFQTRWTDEALILLAQDPQANSKILLGMLGQHDPVGMRWVAVRNLLVGARSAGIAARLLSEVSISSTFHVTDVMGYPPGAGGGRGGGVYDGLPSFATGFPRAGIYDLFMSPQAGCVLFAPGNHPVYYRRAVTARSQAFLEIDYQKYRLEYLAELSGQGLDEIEQALEPSIVIRWTNAKGYRTQVEAALSAQRAAIDRLLQTMEGAGVLRPDEADALQLQIVIEQDDQRKAGPALPEFIPVRVRSN